jgi:hypothetical protein
MRKHAGAPASGRLLTAALLVAGPILMLAAAAVGPNVDSANKGLELARVAAHRDAYFAAGVLFLLGGVAVMVAAIGLSHVFRGRGVLGQIGSGLLAIGTMSMAGWYAFGSVEYEMVNHAGLDRSQMALLLHDGDKQVSGAPLFLLFLVGIVLGLIVLGVAVWRQRVAPRWVAALVALSGPVSFVANGRTLMIVSFAVLLVALAGLAWGALGVREQEWDAASLGPARAGRPEREPAAV